MESSSHFNQPQRRKAEFIHPPHPLKAKVGTGGLDDKTIAKAQKLMESSAIDFAPLAETLLEALEQSIEKARKENRDDQEAIIATILYPAIQLKANGGLFNYPLVTEMAAKLVQFLEVIDEPDEKVLEIVEAFRTTLKAVIAGRVSGHGGDRGRELVQELDKTCYRYFDKKRKK